MRRQASLLTTMMTMTMTTELVSSFTARLPHWSNLRVVGGVAVARCGQSPPPSHPRTTGPSWPRAGPPRPLRSRNPPRSLSGSSRSQGICRARIGQSRPRPSWTAHAAPPRRARRPLPPLLPIAEGPTSSGPPSPGPAAGPPRPRSVKRAFPRSSRTGPPRPR